MDRITELVYAIEALEAAGPSDEYDYSLLHQQYTSELRSEEEKAGYEFLEQLLLGDMPEEDLPYEIHRQLKMKLWVTDSGTRCSITKAGREAL